MHPSLYYQTTDIDTFDADPAAGRVAAATVPLTICEGDQPRFVLVEAKAYSGLVERQRRHVEVRKMSQEELEELFANSPIPEHLHALDCELTDAS